MIPDPRPSADKPLGDVMELNARIVAAAAVAGDFHAEMTAFGDGGRQPDYASWALRLEQHLGYLLDALNDRDEGADDDGLDGLEPYCAECGAWAGMFLGMEGWRHFRGAGTVASPVEIYDAGHEAVPAWCRPRAISPADAVTVARALADAERYRRRRVEDWCADCAGSPAEACDTHLDDLDQADAYAELGRQLQQEAGQ
jgi:hypothetical protein